MATRRKPARLVDDEIDDEVESIEEEDDDEFESGVEIEDDELDEEDEEDEDEPIRSKAKTKPKPTTKKKRRKALNPDELNWDSIMAGFAGQGDVLFIKDTLKVRNLPVYSVDEIFVPVDSFYNGNKSTKYLMPVWWADAPEGGSPIRAVLLTTKLVRAIGALAKDDEYGLFDPVNGVALTIIKSGQGQQSTVQINPGRKAVPIPDEVLEFYDDFDIIEVAKTFSEQQARRNSEQNNSDDDDDSSSSKSGQF